MWGQIWKVVWWASNLVKVNLNTRGTIKKYIGGLSEVKGHVGSNCKNCESEISLIPGQNKPAHHGIFIFTLFMFNIHQSKQWLFLTESSYLYHPIHQLEGGTIFKPIRDIVRMVENSWDEIYVPFVLLL